MKKVVILHNKIESNTPDEIDVLAQKDLVSKACSNLGYEVTCITVGDELKNDLNLVLNLKPDIVFNLVEAIWGKGELVYIVPSFLNALKIPYTGVSLEALFLTTNKVLAKQWMLKNELPTAFFCTLNEMHLLNPYKKYIVKPIWEEASVGISEDYIFQLSETEKVKSIKQLSNSHYFIEEFIEGREFNISILSGKGGPEVLQPAEMIFSDFFKDKHKIVGYKAKWDETSEEYKHTNRSFDTLNDNPELKNKLIEISKKCWEAFNLTGYTRIDLRMDCNENIFILEVNGNPCIAPDSGFIAATQLAGYSNEDVIERILNDFNG
jgi:D-alanine-D-alanine ligase